MSKKRDVQYENSLLTYIDILGFQELIEKKTANDISRAIRVVREAVSPGQLRRAFHEEPAENYINFSDLSIVQTPLFKKKLWTPKGSIFTQILRMVHVQSILLFDHGILIRGGMTVGNAAMSYRQLFGPAIVRAYHLESVVARFPRIVIDETVLEEASKNADVWMHDRETEVRAVRGLLHMDFDGELFIDYLRVIHGELNNPEAYPTYLERHQQLIDEGLVKYRSKPSVLSKFKWLREYHKRTVRKLKN